MPPAKKGKRDKPPPTQPPLPSSHVKVLPLSAWGTKANRANATLGFCKIPDELTLEILSYFPAVGPLTSVLQSGCESPEPILPVKYLERPRVLRALSQTCVAYRRIFLPILWERLEACVESEGKEQFFRHAGETLTRKCTGLIENQDLAAMVTTVNVILTRYKSEMVLSTLTQCLQSMPNLHTLHILHAHTQMTSHIKMGFEGIILPTVRTLIIPGYCHELLKCCPEARSVRCTRDNGSKLVTVIKKFCKKVEEVREFRCDEDARLMKRLVGGTPNLRVLEVRPTPSDEVIALMKEFKHLAIIDILRNNRTNDAELQATVKKLRPVLQANPSKEKKYLRICSRDCTRQGGQATFVNVEMD